MNDNNSDISTINLINELNAMHHSFKIFVRSVGSKAYLLYVYSWKYM